MQWLPQNNVFSHTAQYEKGLVRVPSKYSGTLWKKRQRMREKRKRKSEKTTILKIFFIVPFVIIVRVVCVADGVCIIVAGYLRCRWSEIGKCFFLLFVLSLGFFGSFVFWGGFSGCGDYFKFLIPLVPVQTSILRGRYRKNGVPCYGLVHFFRLSPFRPPNVDHDESSVPARHAVPSPKFWFE